MATVARRIDWQLADEKRQLPPNLFFELAPLGLCGFVVEESSGGLGLTPEECYPIYLALGRLDIGVGTAIGLHNSLGLNTLSVHRKEDSELLRGCASGQNLVSFALTEPAAGSDPRRMEGSATWDPEAKTFTIQARKIWIGLAPWSKYAVTFVKHANDYKDIKAGRISAFLVDMDSEGVTFGYEAATSGLRSIVQSEIYYDAVVVEETALLGEAGFGFDIAKESTRRTRALVAAICIGAAETCFQKVRNFAKARTIATGSLLMNGYFSRKLGELEAHYRRCNALAHQANCFSDQSHDEADWLCAAAKIQCTEMASVVTDTCMQFMGGRGYMENNEVGRFWRDVRALRIYEGPTETLAHYLASAILVHFQVRKAVKTTILEPFANVLLSIADALRKVSKTEEQRLRVELGLLIATVLEHLCGGDDSEVTMCSALFEQFLEQIGEEDEGQPEFGFNSESIPLASKIRSVGRLDQA